MANLSSIRRPGSQDPAPSQEDVAFIPGHRAPPPRRRRVSQADVSAAPRLKTFVASRQRDWGDCCVTPRSPRRCREGAGERDRKSTRLNSSHGYISYAVFCLKKKKNTYDSTPTVRRMSMRCTNHV